MTPVTPAQRAFLDLIAWSEGTSTSSATQNKGYDVIVSGPDGPEVFTDYSDHPFAHRPPKLVRPGLHSTASGRYQVLYRYWTSYRTLLRLPDFSPAAQDAVALQQIRDRSGLHLIDAGRIQAAITACHGLWASMPDNDYHQGEHTMVELLAKYETFTGA